MDYKRFLTQIASVSLGMLITFFGGYYGYTLIHPPDLDVPILSDVHDILLNHALNNIPENPALEYGMIRGMLDVFSDPYTLFYEPPQHELNTNQLEGSYAGIGVELGRDNENYFVLYPFEGGPADNAGIHEGDRLTMVDEFETNPETKIETIQAKIRGLEGTRVRISITRPPNYEIMEFKIKRIDFPLPSVSWHLVSDEPRLGIIDINLISANTPEEILGAVEDLTNRGATKFALDLRDNGGGLLTPGIEVTRLFLSNGVIIHQQYRDQSVESFEVNKPGSLADIPLVAIVNHGTASAAEVIAGALKANNRVILFGETTFGKDTIQLIFDLDDGSSLHVTAARWWIPGLEFPTEKGGLIPDVPVSPSTNEIDTSVEVVVSTLFP
jgi:carboxyl-terminal processing protease